MKVPADADLKLRICKIEMLAITNIPIFCKERVK
jgi:hypothetical protein